MMAVFHSIDMPMDKGVSGEVNLAHCFGSFAISTHNERAKKL
jgi:hypothetical protein